MILSALCALASFLLVSSMGSGCPYIAEQPGTNRTSDDTFIDARVKYMCTEPNTAFSDDKTVYHVRCLPDGRWNKVPHPCQVRRCGAAPVISHTSLSTPSTESDATVVYRCMYGFGFTDAASTKILRCNPDTLQWDTQPGDFIYNMTCEQKVCDQTPLNWNLTTVHYQGLDAYVNGSVAVGRVMTSYCQEGKRVRGNSVQTVHKCGAALSLTGSFSECEDLQCPDYAPPNNTKRVIKNRGYLRRSRYHCKGGRFPGGDTVHVMQCDYNGQWNSEPALSGCQGGGCEAGWVMYNDYCYYISDGTSWGLRYYYAETRCNQRQAHLATIDSREERFFLYSITVEKYLKDFWFGYHYNSTLGEWTWFDEPNGTYRAWHRGYPELQNSCARMSERGVWKDRDCDDLLPYVCKKPTMCGPPPEITYGGPDVDEIPISMDVGQSLVYECDEGYSFRTNGTTNRTVTCMAGSYYSEIENCQRTVCPPLNRPGYWVENAVIVSAQSVGYNSRVTWTCHDGYIFADGTFSKTITCQADRTWSEIPDQCIKVHCAVPAILNAVPEFGVAEPTEVDIYTCKKGYEFSTGETERTMTCLSDGTWIPDDSCWKKECQPYTQLNGNITGGVSGVAKYQERVQITCNNGYNFPDGTMMKWARCGDNFHWDPYLPLCDPLTCPDGVAPHVGNATANTSSADVGAVVLYTCLEGYQFIDGDTERIAVCDTETQQWIDLPTECLGSLPEQVTSNQIAAGKTFSTILAVFGILGLIFLTTFLMCCDFYEDRKVLQICSSAEEDEEDEEEEEKDEDKPEPIRLQMV